MMTSQSRKTMSLAMCARHFASIPTMCVLVMALMFGLGNINPAYAQSAIDAAPELTGAAPVNIMPEPTKDKSAPAHQPTSYEKDIEFFGSKWVISRGYSDTTDTKYLWDSARTNLLRLRGDTNALRTRIKWNTTLWTDEMRREFALHVKAAMEDIDVPVKYLWDSGVADTKVVAKLKAADEALKAEINKVAADLGATKAKLGGLFVGVPRINAIVEVDVHNRKVVRIYDADSGETLIDVAYYNVHAKKKGSHWAFSKLAFVTWAQRPGESAMHHVLWTFNPGYHPGEACPHAPKNQCVQVYASSPTPGYYGAEGMAKELIRQGLTKVEAARLIDQTKKKG